MSIKCPRNSLFLLVLIGCQLQPGNKQDIRNKGEYVSYLQDVTFLEVYTDIIQLSQPAGQGKVAISPALQGRVMTSSCLGEDGRSYGWINRALIESGDTLDHINVFGGEERFWLGPEGGQYSIFFESGSDFNLANWQTPKMIDTESFEVASVSEDRAVFIKKSSLTNYSGFTFRFGVNREVAVLSEKNVMEQLGIEKLERAQVVGYQTINTLTNLDTVDWSNENGLLSIWLLGMFNPSPSTTIVIPYVQGDTERLGVPVNDEYFGKVPDERLTVTGKAIYFKGDGQYRSKIGLSPQRAKNVLGSYDESSQVLTIVKYNKPEGMLDYVNSLWEIQDQPYKGDAVNSYNDGPPEPGKEPLGPFYELETSSPSLCLRSGESSKHIQWTFHFEGDERTLNLITEQVLGVSIDEIKEAFN